MELIRRAFLSSLATSVVANCLSPYRRLRIVRTLKENTGAIAPGCTFLNEQQASLLGEICDCLIPPDEYPGGKDAGCVFFVDRALSTWAPQHRWDYVYGLEAIDESSQRLYGATFLKLESVQRERVLQQIEAGTAAGDLWRGFTVSRKNGSERPLESEKAVAEHSGPSFFHLLLSHVMQGYYGNPEYGGNLNRESWRMLGYLETHHAP
jgi:gluconate 2-dehydrogenase gamma chain